MNNKEAIANLNHIYGVVSPDIQRSLDLAIKALETVESIKVFIKKHSALDSLELMCIKDIINGECEE